MGAVYCQLVTFEGPMATEQAGGLFLNSFVEVLKSSLLRTAVISQQEKKKKSRSKHMFVFGEQG